MPDQETRRRIHARLEELHERCEREDPNLVERYYAPGRGYYPPEKAGEEREQFAVCVATTDGEIFEAGDSDLPFALQSLSKVFAYGLALADHGPERVLERVGVEPSGEAFNSLRFDERNMRPFNPMINAGALVTSELVAGAGPGEQFHRLLDLMRASAGNDAVAVDDVVLNAELDSADRNRGTAYLMRSAGMLHGDVEGLLELYLRHCSVAVSCRDLAVMGATLADGGRNPLNGAQVLPRRRVRDVLSVMLTCGMYDYAGSWAFEVGLPAKSGVSGGILAVIPGKFGIGVFSPGLDVYGNSVRGVQVCEDLSDRLGLHLFATEEEDAMLTAAAPSA